MSVGISINEENLAKLLLGQDGTSSPGLEALNPNGVRQLLGCLGEVFSCGIGPNVKAHQKPEQPFRLNIESTDYSRLRVDMDTVGFQSFVSLATLARCVF